jgi:hypothetical protein
MVVIISDGVIYIDSSVVGELFGSLAGLSDLPDWFSMDFADAADMALYTRPEQVFALLKLASVSITEEEGEKIRGVETRHFVLVVEPDAIEADETLSDGGLFGLELSDAPDEVAVEVWIDEGDLVRRIAYSYDSEWDSEGATVSIATEFFDYGEALDIETPDSDDAEDFEEWLQSAFDDISLEGFGPEAAFAEAECYGDRFAECLEPNPDLEDLYGDPAECFTETARVCLVPAGYVRRDVVESIIAFHRETKGIEIIVLPSVAIDPAHVDEDASLGITEQIYLDVKAAYGFDGDTPSTFIALTPIDLGPEDGQFSWWFGCRYGGGSQGQVHGIFSYFRMANVEPYDGSPLDDDLLFERATKYMARYVAVLHLKWPMDTDIRYLNYHEMYGFSDLDSMQPNWPVGTPPCRGEGPIICIAPDAMYMDERFEADIRAVVDRLEAATGIKVEIILHSGAYPTYDPWSEEYYDDLHHYMSRVIQDPDVLVIGVTDDPFAEDWDRGQPIGAHITRAWPEEYMAVASGFDAGAIGSVEHRERMFRLLLRAVRLAQGEPESVDPHHLLYSGHDEPADLDGVTAGLP